MIKDNRTKKIYSAISFTTMQLPCFNKYRDLFYELKVKRVPDNIYELLTPRGLAFWLMDDGSRHFPSPSLTRWKSLGKIIEWNYKNTNRSYGQIILICFFLLFGPSLSVTVMFNSFSQILFNPGSADSVGFLISPIKNKKYKLDLNIPRREFSQQTFKINPYYVSGLVDAEGCFLVQIYRDSKYTTGWRVKITFTVVLHSKDMDEDWFKRYNDIRIS